MHFIALPVALLATALSLRGSPADSVRQEHAPKCKARWSDARALSRGATKPFVNSPVVLTRASDTLWFGAPIFGAGSDKPTLGRSGIGFAVRGESLSPITAPSNVVSPPGVLAAFNSQPFTRVVLRAPEASVGSDAQQIALWTAELHGRRLENLRHVFAANTFYAREDMSAASLHGGDVLFAAYTIYRRETGVLALSFVDGEWRTSTMTHRGIPGFVSAVALGADSVLVVFTATDPSAHVNNGTQLFMSYYLLRARTFSPAVRIAWVGTNHVRSPSVAFAEGDSRRLTLVWGLRIRGHSGIDSLITASSNDDGKSWQPVSRVAVDLPGMLVANNDARSRRHIIVAGRDGGRDFSQEDLAWRWTALPPGAGQGSSITLSRLQSGDLLAAWEASDRPTSRGTVPWTVFSILKYQCDHQHPPQARRQAASSPSSAAAERGP